MSRSTLLLLVAIPAVFVVACGSDTTSGTTSTGAGGEASTTATGTGGAGGSGGSISTTGTGSSTATSTSSGSSSASGSTGTGMMMMGACTNPTDLGIVQTKDVKKITADCGKMHIGNDAATKTCIKMGTSLSDPCVTCFADTVSCVISKCLQPCLADSGSQACTDCRAMNCDPAFKACSGLPTN